MSYAALDDDQIVTLRIKTRTGDAACFDWSYKRFETQSHYNR